MNEIVDLQYFQISKICQYLIRVCGIVAPMVKGPSKKKKIRVTIRRDIDDNDVGK